MPSADGKILVDIDFNFSKAFRDVEGFGKRASRMLALGRMSDDAREFSKSLAASNARVIAFGASAGLIFGIEKAFTSLLKTTVEVEKQLKDINVLFNLSDKSLAQLSDSLFSIGKQTGQSFKVVAAAAVELSRQGLSVESTLKRVQSALILTRLSGLDAKESVEDITAALNTFNELANDSTILINKLATVDSKFAVSSRDLADAIKRVGSTATDTGVSFDSLIALVTSAQQVTARGGSVIGNAFKTIFQRLNRPETLDFLESFNISVRDLQGEALAADKILLNLAARFNNLTGEQKNQVVQLSAGVFQANVFRAILQDLGKETSFYAGALKTSNQATDEAIKRNEELNQSLDALFGQFKNNLAQVGSKVGNITFAPLIRNLLGGVNQLLERAAKDEGLGASLGEGILKGLGQYLSGPGALLVGVTVGKLVAQLGSFAGTALKAFWNLNKSLQDNVGLAQKRLSIEQQVLATLQAQSMAGGRGGGGGGGGFSPTLIRGKEPFLNSVQGPMIFNRLSPKHTNQLNAEMMRLLDISKDARFNLGSASAHLAKMARTLGMTNAEVSQLLGAFKINVGNAKTYIANQKQAQALIPVASQLIAGGRARDQLKTLDPQMLAAINAERTSKIQNRVFGASFIAPLVTGAAGEMTGDSLPGRRARSVLSGIGDTASFAGLGFMAGGAAGAGIGAGVGALKGITAAMSSWSDILPDLHNSLKKIVETTGLTSANFADLNLLINQLKNTTNASERQKLSMAIKNRISSFSPEMQSRIAKGLREGGGDALPTIENEFLLEQARDTELQQLKIFVEQNKKKFVSWGQPGSSEAGVQPSLSPEGKALVAELASKMGGLGFGSILSDPKELDAMKAQFDKNPSFPLMGLTKSLRNKGKFSEATAVNESLGGFGWEAQRLIMKGLMENLGPQSKNVESVYSSIFPADVSAAKSKYTAPEVQNMLQSLIGQTQSRTTGLSRGNISATLGSQSALSMLASDQNAALDQRSRFISPIAKAKMLYNQQQDLLINQTKSASQKNIRGLGMQLGGLGTDQLMGMRETVAQNAQGNGEFLNDFTLFINSLSKFTEQSKTGTINLSQLESFVKAGRSEFAGKDSIITDRALKDSLSTTFDNLLQSIQDTANQEYELSEELSENQIVAANELKNVIALIKMFETRVGLRGLFDAGKMSGRQLAEGTGALRYNERREEGFSSVTGISHALESFTNELRYNLLDLFDDLDSAAAEVAATMKSGFKGALYDFASGTVSATQALRNFGLSIADKIFEKTLSMGVDSLIGAATSVGSSVISNWGKKANGGVVRGYAAGGFVNGGSGYKDDVPMMLAEGSYVIKKSSVSKYGASFLSKLNDNKYNYNNNSRPTSGSNAVSANLSNFALSDENNPQNAIRMGRESDLFQYIKDKIDYDNNVEQSMRDFKRAKRQRIQAAYLGAAMNVIGSGVSGAMGPKTAAGTTGYSSKFRGEHSFGGSGTPPAGYVPVPNANGGLISRFAAGGFAGKDNIPALVMGGEFIMNRGAVNKYGVDFFNRVNSGSLPKFAMGGLVSNGSVQNNEEGSTSKLNDSLMKLILTTESLRLSLDKTLNAKEFNRNGSVTSAAGATAAPMSVQTNIHIHMSEAGPKAEVSTQTQGGTASNNQNQDTSKMLGEQIKTAVLKVVIDESRPGGYIYQQIKKG